MPDVASFDLDRYKYHVLHHTEKEADPSADRAENKGAEEYGYIFCGD